MIISDTDIMVTMYDVTPDSTLSVWWRCEQGHNYKMRVCDRVKASADNCKCNCPVCNINNWTKYAESGTTPVIDIEE